MSRTVFSFLVFVLLSMSSSVAQQKSYSVTQQKEVVIEVEDLALLDVNRAKLSNIIARNSGKSGERFELSFNVPEANESSLKRVQVELTAYKSDGRVHGRQIWRSGNLGKIEKVQDFATVTLRTDPKLNGANSFKLGLTSVDADDAEALTMSCDQCVTYANNTCGRGGVSSVTCGADGTCSFTCK